MRSVVRRAVAVLLVGFVVGGVAARWPAFVAAQTDPSVSPTPPPTVTGSKVTAAPTTAAPRPVTTATRTRTPAPASAPPGTKAAAVSEVTTATVLAPTAVTTGAAPTTVAPTAAVTTGASTTASTVTTTGAAIATPSSPPSTAGIGDAEASRRVRRISWSLVALAGGLFALTLWFWRTTRPVPAELGGLAVMGTRRWRRAPAPRRDELVTGSRPARLGAGDELFVDPADVPALASRDASTFDALDALGTSTAEPSTAEPASIAVPDPWAGAAAASMVDVLPGAGPLMSADVGSVPTSSATAPSAPVPPPPVAVPTATPAAMPVVQPLEPTADPAHLSVHLSAAVVSPPGSLVSEGSATGASLLPPTAAPSRVTEPTAPAMPVELSPAIDGLSPLVEVVPSPEPGFVALEPIPADQFASGPASGVPPD